MVLMRRLIATLQSVSYGSGSFSGMFLITNAIFDVLIPYVLGMEYLDTVTISSGLVITKQSIGVASNSSGFDEFDGILG